jgi:hypothetical protein
MQSKQNVSFDFTPSFEITEGKDNRGQWLKIGGVALKEGVSRNNNQYTYENLTENNGQEFKWLFGHPSDNVEEHVIGLGQLHLNGADLMHEGKIRNTARHPDVVEMVRDNLLGPSIHATAKEIIKEEGVYKVKGLMIEAVGLVAFQGVKSASIDYAIAESFERKESCEQDVIEEEVETKVTNMEEEVKVEVEATPIVEAVVEPVVEPVVEAESFSSEDIKLLKEELNKLKNSAKVDVIESLIIMNKDLKKDELMTESIEQLNLRKEYETKLAGTTESVAVVETEEVEETGTVVVESNGDYTMSKSMYEKFNKELRERVR